LIVKRKEPAVCDAAERQYGQFIREHKDQLENYDSKTQRLDEFYFGLLSEKESYRDLWTVIQLVLVLSHGQASVERSFSINEDILLPNMKAQTLYAIMFISDLFSVRISCFQSAVFVELSKSN